MLGYACAWLRALRAAYGGGLTLFALCSYLGGIARKPSASGNTLIRPSARIAGSLCLGRKKEAIRGVRGATFYFNISLLI